MREEQLNLKEQERDCKESLQFDQSIWMNMKNLSKSLRSSIKSTSISSEILIILKTKSTFTIKRKLKREKRVKLLSKRFKLSSNKKNIKSSMKAMKVLRLIKWDQHELDSTKAEESSR